MRLQKIFNLSIVAVAMSIAVVSCGKVPNIPEGEFLIHGSLTSVRDSSVVNIINYDEDGRGEVIDIDTIIGGKFTLRGVSPTSGMFALVGDSDDFSTSSVDLYIEAGDYIEVSGDGYTTPMWRVKSTNPKQKKLDKFYDVGREQLAKISPLFTAERKLINELIEKAKAGERDAFKKRMDELDYYSDLRKKTNSSIGLSRLEYLKGERVDQVWIDCFEKLAKTCKYQSTDTLYIDACKELYPKLPESFVATDRGAVITAALFPPKVVDAGEMMVDATLYDTQGREHTLSEFKGRYILLDFWRRGCGPCEMSFPESERMAEKYASILSIVSISSDTKEVWMDFVNKKDLKGNHWNELSAADVLEHTYGARSIPFYVLISPSGVIIAKWSGYATGYLESQLFKYLGNI